MKQLMRIGKVAVVFLLILAAAIFLFMLIKNARAAPIDTYHSSWHLVRETGSQDGDTLAAVYNLTTAGNFANKDTSTVLNGGAFRIPSFNVGLGNEGFSPGSSSAKYKRNIRDLKDSDVAGLYRLRPRKFDSKDGTQRDAVGLIAEEVDLVMPKIVRYKKNTIYRDEITLDSNGDEVVTKVFDHFETTNEPDGVDYSCLIVPLLKEVQTLRAEVDVLNSKVGRAELRSKL